MPGIDAANPEPTCPTALLAFFSPRSYEGPPSVGTSLKQAALSIAQSVLSSAVIDATTFVTGAPSAEPCSLTLQQVASPADVNIALEATYTQGGAPVEGVDVTLLNNPANAFLTCTPSPAGGPGSPSNVGVTDASGKVTLLCDVTSGPPPPPTAAVFKVEAVNRADPTLMLTASTSVPPLNTSSLDLACFIVDRCAPAEFTDVYAFQGRSDPLQLTVDMAPACPSDTFYYTQGRKRQIFMPLGEGENVTYSASLWLPVEWSNVTGGANSYRRSDIWAATSLSTEPPNNDITAYPIIGFTNYGGAPRFRGFNIDVGGWIDFPVPVVLGGWSPTLSIVVSRAPGGVAAGVSYYVGGALMWSSVANGIAFDADTLKEVFVQVYRYGPNVVTPAQSVPYSVVWSDLAVTTTNATMAPDWGFSCTPCPLPTFAANCLDCRPGYYKNAGGNCGGLGERRAARRTHRLGVSWWRIALGRNQPIMHCRFISSCPHWLAPEYLPARFPHCPSCAPPPAHPCSGVLIDLQLMVRLRGMPACHPWLPQYPAAP
jgi:hypothetical protein